MEFLCIMTKGCRLSGKCPRIEFPPCIVTLYELTCESVFIFLCSLLCISNLTIEFSYRHDYERRTQRDLGQLRRSLYAVLDNCSFLCHKPGDCLRDIIYCSMGTGG